MKLNITAEHCKPGHECKSTKCVIAAAINDILRPPYLASVGVWGFGIVDTSKPIPGEPDEFNRVFGEEPMSDEAVKIVENYDLNRKIEPRVIDFPDIPQEFLREPLPDVPPWSTLKEMGKGVEK